MSNALPVYAQFLAALSPLIKDVAYTVQDQGSFVKLEVSNGHKIYVAKQVTSLKRIDTTFAADNLIPLAKKNGKIVGQVPPSLAEVAEHILAMAQGAALPATVRGQAVKTPVDITSLMAAE